MPKLFTEMATAASCGVIPSIECLNNCTVKDTGFKDASSKEIRTKYYFYVEEVVLMLLLNVHVNSLIKVAE
jgi:hypothetical protein